jgi:DNA-binding XRE family transcriptional regulator
LKQEIARLARRAMRSEIEGIRKANAQHRRDIAGLKRQVAQLARQNAALAKRGPAAAARPDEGDAGKPRLRFVAKGLRSQRTRLGLSADAFAKLAGVSAQTIYNWERGQSYPRTEQLARLVGLRGIGKREAGKRLDALSDGKRSRRRVARAEQ